MKSESPTLILVVEGEQSAKNSLDKLLEQSVPGICVKKVNSLAQARQFISLSPPDLIISELSLCDGNATTLLKTTCEFSPFAMALLIDIDQEKEAINALKSGCIDYILRSEINASSVSRIVARLFRQWSYLNRFVEFERTQRDLLVSKRQLDTILQSEPECVKTVARDGSLLDMNPAGLKMVEADHLEQVKGESVYDLIAPSYRADFIKMNEAVFSGKSGSLEFELVTLKGNYRWMDTTATPLYNDAGGVISHLAVTRDITERKEAQKKLKTLYQDLDNRVQERTIELSRVNDTLIKANIAVEKANTAKDDFLASMSHEIRTPMNGILGLVDLLEQSDLNERQQQYIRTIQRSSNTLITVINDILDYSKIEAGKMELEHQSFDLKELIDDISASYSATIKKTVKLQVNLDPEIPAYLIGDTVRLHQVLSNLLNNAFKFTSEGMVSIDISRANKHDKNIPLEFVIRDTGIGISAEVQENLFKPFTQADQSTTRKYGGTGLGLAICKRLVESMGGEIHVDSQLGKGACFTVRIEFEAKQNQTQERSHVEYEKDFGQLRVLLVEDNPVNQMVCKELMRKLGVQCQLATSGVEAVELVCNTDNRFDLIMMDCEMPGMDGYSATRIIRSWEASGDHVPTTIHACTAHVLSTSVKKCNEAGMDDHISKPISLEKLIRTFEKVQIKL